MALLIDVLPFEPRIVESSDNGIMKIEGVFQRCDIKNANNRVYPRKIWERLLGEKSPLAERMHSRAVLGHLEHPSDGVTDLRKGAILITGLKLDEKGQVLGSAEILDTPDGKIVQEYIRKKVRIGISSRGSGTVGSDGRVSDDYQAESFDIVYNPSTPGAYPEGVEESLTNHAPKPKENKKENGMDGLEKFQLLEVNLKPLLEQDMSGLAPFQVADLGSKLLEASVKLGALVSETPALAGVIEDAQKRISEKRTALAKPVEESTEDAAGKEDFSAVEELLEKATVKITESQKELEETQAALKDAESLAEEVEAAEEEAEEVMETSEELYNSQRQKLTESQDRVKYLEERLAAAVSLISMLMSERRNDDNLAEEIADAIEEVVEAEPRLKEAVDILADCESPDEVYDAADQMLKDLKENTRKTSRAPSTLQRLHEEEDRLRGKRTPARSRKSIFEDLESEEDLVTEREELEGEFVEDGDRKLMEHKGRRLAKAAIGSLK